MGHAAPAAVSAPRGGRQVAARKGGSGLSRGGLGENGLGLGLENKITFIYLYSELGNKNKIFEGPLGCTLDRTGPGQG